MPLERCPSEISRKTLLIHHKSLKNIMFLEISWLMHSVTWFETRMFRGNKIKKYLNIVL